MHLLEEDIQKTVAEILGAVQLLDQDPHVKELQRAEHSKYGKAVKTYFLKRNGSYGGMRQVKFSLNSTCQNQKEPSNESSGVCAAEVDDMQHTETCGR